MNKLFTKRMKTIAFFGTIGVLSFTLVAKPAFKAVRAYINPTISYTLDGEKVLKNAKTITYDNKTYVPLADVAKLMGLQTRYQNNTIIMTTKPQVTTDGAFQITPQTTGTVTIPKAIIKEVKVESKTVTIFKAGAEDKTENYIILNISDITKIVKERDTKTYALTELKTGMEVSVKHSNIITSSLPPQTTAFEIKMLTQKLEDDKDVEDDKDDVDNKQTSLKDAKIVEINNSGKYIIIEGVTKDGKPFKILFDNKTKVKYEDSKKQPNTNALKAGQIADIKLEGARILEMMVKGK